MRATADKETRMSDTLLDAARHAASWCCARSEAMTTTKTEGHRMLLAKIARTPGCRWFVHRDGTTYYSVLRSNARVSG